MGDKSGIEWTDATWNPISGCSKVSQGCKHCYAKRDWKRLSAPGQPYAGRAFEDVATHPERLDQPLRWRRPRRIFVNSMSDLFHADVPDEFIARVWGVMYHARNHTFQILTKRPTRMRDFLQRCANSRGWITHNGTGPEKAYLGDGIVVGDDENWPLPNVWLGVSVEDQATADERIPQLLDTPATVRSLSCEPLLGAVDLTHLTLVPKRDPKSHRPGVHLDALASRFYESGLQYASRGIDWVIVGGESGPHARPMHPKWAGTLRDQCAEAGVAFHFKQWGEWAPRGLHRLTSGEEAQVVDPRCERWPQVIRLTEGGENGCISENTDGGEDRFMQRVGKKAAGRLLDGRTWDEYPEVRA